MRAALVMLAACGIPVPAPLKTTPVVLAESELPMEITLSPDGATAFFVKMGSGTTGPRDSWTLNRVPTDGGKPREIFRGEMSTIIADATHVYFIGGEKIPEIGGPMTIKRVTHDGGDAEFVAGAPGMLLGFAIDDDNIYWTEHDTGNVQMKPKHGGDTTTLASNQQAPVEIVIDRDYVYWMNNTKTDPETLDDLVPKAIIQRVPKTGGAIEVVLRKGPARGLLLANEQLYWFGGKNELNHHVLRTSTRTGGEIRTVGPFIGSANDVAVCSDGVYVTESEHGALHRVRGGKIETVHRGRAAWNIACSRSDGDVLVWTDLYGGKVMRFR